MTLIQKRVRFFSSLMLVAIMTWACSSLEVVGPQSLKDQLLMARPEYPGKLTHSRCLEYDGEKCEKWEMLDYDLSDEKFRHDANALNFICTLGDKFFKICLDKAGYCHHYYTGFWPFRKRNETFVSASDHEFILRAGTQCQSSGGI